MKEHTKAGAFDAFLKRFSADQEPLHPSASAAQILLRLSEMEEEAALFYEGLAHFTDDPWITHFAAKAAFAERAHQKWYYNAARMLDGKPSNENSMTPLPEEVRQLMCTGITPRKEAAQKSALYLDKKDAVDIAIAAEDKTIQLLGQLHLYLAASQHDIIHKVLQEELKHKAALESFRKTMN